MPRRNMQLAAYARVSSEKQVQQRTIESQVAAIQERVEEDGERLPPERCFIDDGYSGETLERPALERLRDQISAGEIDRLYIHSPDRLSRRYAHQVLLLEEFQRAGVEVVFLNARCDESPEGELLLQIQGVIAEYERAKMLERCRRGRKQRARAGDVSVFTKAPFGYRYVEKRQTGKASFEILPEEAGIVRLIYGWYVRDGMAIHAIARRLNEQKQPTRTRKALWRANSVWNVLRNPAYMGRARFGRLRTGPRRPRVRAYKRQAEQPRVRHSVYRTAREDQIEIRVPAIVDEDLFQEAQQRLEANRLRCRTGTEGPRHLLQGLVVCRQCGRALIHHLSAGKKKPYHYYRCTGLGTHRWGGARICSSRPVRAEHLEQAVWEDAVALLADPERLQREYDRRLADLTDADSTDQAMYHKLIGRNQQAWERLLDAYQDGLIGKADFEARATTLRQRIEQLEAEARAAETTAAIRTNLRQSVESFEAFAEQIRRGLDLDDFLTRVTILRLLIKQIEVHDETITIVYKVNPRPFELAPEKGISHDCSRRQHLVVPTPPTTRYARPRSMCGARNASARFETPRGVCSGNSLCQNATAPLPPRNPPPQEIPPAKLLAAIRQHV